MSISLSSPYILFRKDGDDHLRQIIHWFEPYTLPENAEEQTPSYLATYYMQDASEVYESTALIDELNVEPSIDLSKDYPELRLLEVVEKAGINFFFYTQTYFGIPMWNQGMVIEVTPEPLEIRYYAATSSYVFFVSSPPDAASFCADMRYRDTYFALNEPPIQVDNVRMGTSHKVITWAFEKLAAFNAPSPTPPNPPAPPTFDIYIDDGRNGEYNYITNFWSTTEIFNRHQNDGQTNQTHQNPIPGTPNYLFVRVKNRGQLNADNILVNGYRCAPGGGMVWPLDWILLNNTPVSGGTALTPGGSRIVGPITWTPPTGQNHICLLVTVEASGDVPNTWYPIANTTIPDWHLVPTDNNVAQRNLNLLQGWYGSDSVSQAVNASSFLVRNPYYDPTSVDLQVHVPQLLINKGWLITFDTGNHIELEAFDREGIPVRMRMSGGKSFTRQDIMNTDDRDIIITMVSDKGIIGGLTYRIDPNLNS